MMRRAEVLEAAATTTDAAEQPRRVVVTDHAADHFEAAKTAPDSMPVKSMTRTIVEGENEMERHMRTIMQTIQEGAEQTATDMRDLAVAEREHTIQLVAGEVARQLGHGAGGTDARMSTAPLEERHGEASSTRGSRCWCRCRRRRWEGGGRGGGRMIVTGAAGSAASGSAAGGGATCSGSGLAAVRLQRQHSSPALLPPLKKKGKEKGEDSAGAGAVIGTASGNDNSSGSGGGSSSADADADEDADADKDAGPRLLIVRMHANPAGPMYDKIE